jgi:hypothetical protein
VIPVASAGRTGRLGLDPAAVAAGNALGLTASTPREVHERLLPLLGDDLDFARVLRVQLDAARASILGRPGRDR